jgi:hypothetical protein
MEKLTKYNSEYEIQTCKVKSSLEGLRNKQQEQNVNGDWGLDSLLVSTLYYASTPFSKGKT